MNKHEMDLTRGSIIPQIIKYAIPIVLSGILQLAFNAADLIVVGQFAGEGSIGAVGATGSLTGLLVNVLMGISVGACTIVARYIGAGDREAANRAAHTSIVLAVLGGVVLAVFGFVFSRTFLEWMDTPADIIDRSEIYIKIYFIGLPANMLYNFAAAIMRATGDTKRPLHYLAISGVVNVIFNLIMVIVFDMGVAGVAIATVVSQALSAVFTVRALAVTEGTCRLAFKKLRIYKKELIGIAHIGIPSGIQSSLFAISNVIIQSSINSFGSYATDGTAAQGNLEGFVYVAMHSCAQAALAFVSQNFGAKDKKRVLRSSATCIGEVVVIGLILGTVLYIFRYSLLGIYLGDNMNAIEYGIRRAMVTCFTYFMFGMVDTLGACLRGLGWSMAPTVITFAGSCAFRVFWVFFVFPLHRTYEFLYISYPISWFITSAVLFACFAYAYKKFVRDMVQERIQ